jgi:D-alanyl-D-alanine dipeptidase
MISGKDEVKLKECGEPLVSLDRSVRGTVIFLDAPRLRVEGTARVREGVAARLKAAKAELPRGWNFIVRDAWRPAFVQAQIFFEFLAKAESRFPGLSPAERRRLLKVMVAPWFGDDVSGHLTGGALDLRLVDGTGRRVPMRGRALGYLDNAKTDQPLLAPHLRRNRLILKAAMETQGFSNHPGEFWHYSYGDWHWARRTGIGVAIYGAVPDTAGLYADRECPCGSGKPFVACHVVRLPKIP